MARSARAARTPPPTAAAAWTEFMKWALGVPLVCAGGLGIVAGALWLAGGQELMWRTTVDMGTSLFWIAAIALMYPLMLFFWVEDLRAGLKATRDWRAMTPEAQAAAIAAAGMLTGKRRKKRDVS